MSSLQDLCLNYLLSQVDIGDRSTQYVQVLPVPMLKKLISSVPRSLRCGPLFRAYVSRLERAEHDLNDWNITTDDLTFLLESQEMKWLRLSQISHLDRCASAFRQHGRHLVCLQIDDCPDYFVDFSQLINLKTLSLYSRHIKEETLNYLPLSITSLKLSQISVSSDAALALNHIGRMQLETLWVAENNLSLSALNKLLESFPRLQSLDLSSSQALQNFAVPFIEPRQCLAPNERMIEVFHSLTRIISLRWLNLSNTSINTEIARLLTSRLPSLSFLGVVRCPIVEFEISHIRIASTHTPDQIKHAMMELNSRFLDSCRILSDLFAFVSSERFVDPQILPKVIEIVRGAMASPATTIPATAVIFYLCRKSIEGQDESVRTEILRLIIELLSTPVVHPQLSKNCCSVLLHFHAEWKYFAPELCNVLVDSLHSNGRLTEKFFLLKFEYICCDFLAMLDPSIKQRIVQSGTIPKIISVINLSLTSIHPDANDFVKCCCSFLWNITDETPCASRIFLEQGGMDIILALFQKYSGIKEMEQFIMGFVANIAEVPANRPSFMTVAIINQISGLIDEGKRMNQEPAYNACSVLCQLFLEGEKFWVDHGLELSFRDQLLDQIFQAVSCWPENSNRWINYRSFKPLLYILQGNVGWQCQFWSSWAILNLIRATPEKYLELCVKEDVSQYVEALLHTTTAVPVIVQLESILIILNNNGVVVDV